MGSLAFYNGMMPGITKAIESLADDTAYSKGYKLQAGAMNDLASARKHDADALKVRHEMKTGDDAAMDFVMGTHGISRPEFESWRAARSGGTMPAGTSAGPGFSPEQTDRYNAALRDYAAMMTRKPHDVSQFSTQMAQLPAVQRSVEAAGRNDARSASDIMLNQAALGKDVMADKTPAQIRTAQYLLGLSPGERAQTVSAINSIHPPATQINMPGATHYGTEPATGRPGMFQIGKDGKQIFTPIDPPPPTNPIDRAVDEALKGRGKQPPQQQKLEKPPAPEKREKNRTYDTPKGPMKWTGTGWVNP